MLDKFLSPKHHSQNNQHSDQHKGELKFDRISVTGLVAENTP